MAGDAKVERLMKAVENDCTEDRLALNQFDESSPQFDENDSAFVLASSSATFNLLLNLTTGEADAKVRRCRALGGLSWKRLTSSLSPSTLASGIEAISAVLADVKIQQPTKADRDVEIWEDREKGTAQQSEYGQVLLDKNLQGGMSCASECALDWVDSRETEAGVLFTNNSGADQEHRANLDEKRAVRGPWKWRR